jgi:epsilon-lactone hydrolase
MADNPRLARLVEVLRERRVAPGSPVELQRSGMELACERLPLADGITITTAVSDGGPVEWLEPAEPVGPQVVLWFHGGGYVMGSRATVRSMVSHLVALAGIRAVTLDYRLAPEHPFPAAVEDGVAAYQWLLSEGLEPAQIALGGDSAGGGLVLAALLAVRDRGLPLPAAGVCVSPWTDLTLSGPSLDANAATDPQVSRDGLSELADHYLAGHDPSDPLASPLFADLTGLPPLLIHVGAVEGLLDDSTRIAVCAEAVGVDVTLECWEDMIHVWHAFAPGLPEAVAGLERVAEWLRERWPVGAASES